MCWRCQQKELSRTNKLSSKVSNNNLLFPATFSLRIEPPRLPNTVGNTKLMVNAGVEDAVVKSLSPFFTDSLTRALIFRMRLKANPAHRHSGSSSIQGMLAILRASTWQRLINRLREPGADLRVHKGYKRHPSLCRRGLIKVRGGKRKNNNNNNIAPCNVEKAQRASRYELASQCSCDRVEAVGVS